jgi:starch synthase
MVAGMAGMRIAFATSELTPFAKTGGLGDVTAALAQYLHRAGHDVRVFLPLYAAMEGDRSQLYPVDFIQNVSIGLGPRSFVFSLHATRLGSEGPEVYFVSCPALYARPTIYTSDADEHLRFLLLSRASIECCQRMGFAPQIFHCHDWQTALVPLFLQTIYGWDRLFHPTRTVLTIHNLGYQGVFPASVAADLALHEHTGRLHQDDLRDGVVNFLKTGLLYAHVLTTVSETYAEEIQTEAQGFGLHDYLRARRSDLIGILNGVDYGVWNPETDRRIPHPYSPADLSGKEKNKQHLMRELGLHYDPVVPAMGIITRLVAQKGVDLMKEVLPSVLSRRNLRLVVLGSGEHEYEDFFTRLQRVFPRRVCFYRGFNAKLAALIEAGCDMFLMPSQYEPCGLNQMYSLRYGTVPIVRRTGGLADTVTLYNPQTGEGTGIVFDHYSPQAMSWAIGAALDLYPMREAWTRIVKNGMSQDFSWERQGNHYVRLYARLAGLPADV